MENQSKIGMFSQHLISNHLQPNPFTTHSILQYYYCQLPQVESISRLLNHATIYFSLVHTFSPIIHAKQVNCIENLHDMSNIWWIKIQACFSLLEPNKERQESDTRVHHSQRRIVEPNTMSRNQIQRLRIGYTNS